MWVAKLKICAQKGTIQPYAIKHKVDVSGYALKYWKKGKTLHVLVAGRVFGSEKNKKEFFKDLRESDGFVEGEVNGDFILCVIKTLAYYEPMYIPKVIWIKPAFISKEGYQLWELGSWDKKSIDKVILMAQKHYEVKLLKSAKERVGNIEVISVVPEITGKQRKALWLAVENGYYDYPRKIELKELARMMHLSYSTYQAHLRKAERSIIPALFSKYK